MGDGRVETTLCLERTFQISRVPKCIVDREGRIMASNAAFVHAIGTSNDDSIRSIFVDANERAIVAAALSELRADGSAVTVRGRCNVTGGTRALSWSCAVIDDVIVVELDDSIERSARESELEALLRALPDIYFRLDAAGTIVDFHAAREAEFHVPPEMLRGRRPQDLVPPEVAPLVASAVERAGTDRVAVQIEYALPTPSGDDQFEAYIVPCGDTEVTAVIRNTTARHRAEAALRASEERLRASQKLDAIGQLAGGVAHDFNNLLGVILGRLTFLQRAHGLGESERDHVAEALDAALHAASLTRQLLAFGRRQVLQPRIFDLNTVLSSMSEMLRRVAGEHIEIDLDLSPSGCSIDSDPVQIEQVVLNLVLNARHAMPEGGTIDISTRTTWLDARAAAARETRPGSFVIMTVRDEGAGMAPHVLEHLFEPFFTTKAQGEGTGLGLATVYGIVKQSGGHTAVESQLGIGTTFELSFPLASAEAAELVSDEAPTSSLKKARGDGETILVVEDAIGMRLLVSEILQRVGYRVLAASSGDDALRIIAEEQEPIAMVITDVVMPKMSGRTLAMRIRERLPNTPVLLISGYETSKESLPHAQSECPSLPLLEKPFTEEALLTRVLDVLDRGRGLASSMRNTANHEPR